MKSRTIVLIVSTVVILGILAVVFIPRLLNPKAKVSWPTQGWPTTTPEEAGLDSQKLAGGLMAIQERGAKLDSLLVIRHGAALLDAAFYPYNGAYLHDLASVTKSFMTTLIGIAVDQGVLKLDQPVLSFFPEREIANRDERKERMTVEHLVSMRNGFESGCLPGDMPTIAAMMSQPDWVQAALDRKMAAEPGTVNCYDSPGMHLLSAILTKATGMTALEFARQNLFSPLGIQEAYWDSDPQGLNRGWGDLHLKPSDAAKLGYLWLHQGTWNGKQVVSSEWVKNSLKYHSDFGDDNGYGFGWWLWEGGYEASGRGGQAIKVVPGMDVVVVTTGGGFDYDRDVDPHLVGAVTDLENPLPANPAGNAALSSALAEISKGIEPQPVPALPNTAKEISGRIFVFKPNPAALETAALEFNDSNEAVLRRKYTGIPEISGPVGLDGIFRSHPNGDLASGYWKDPQTFILRLKDVEDLAYEFRFQGDILTILAPDGIMLEGQVASQ